jgi:uncharacterized protein (TIGR02449 family)
MDAEFDALENKVNRLLELCRRLCRENQQLRQELVSALNEKRHLTEKVTTARSRLETLLSRLPEHES